MTTNEVTADSATQVVIVGAGPVGLLLAAELRLAGVGTVVLEREPAPSPHPKALGLHARTLEQLAMRGLVEPFLAGGVRVPAWHFGFLAQRLDLTRLDTPYPFLLAFPQDRTEAVLRDRALALGARIHRGEPVTGLVEDAGGVRGVPGGLLRFTGYDPEHQDPERRDLTPDELRETVGRISGADFGVRDPVWLTRFGNATRVAGSYRRGRVLLAGDAAHMHFPAGGVGLNLGLQDAMNLGWKLAAVVRGRAGDELLDTYHAERRPWAEDVAEHTLAQTALITATSPTGQALRRLFSDLIGALPDLALTLARRLAGLDVRYGGGAHPLVGSRVAEAGGALLDGRPALLGTPDPAVAAAVVVRPDGYVGWATDDPDESPGERPELGWKF